MSDEAWNEVLKLDLTGTFNCSRAVAPGMIERRHGRIINISSMSYRGNIGQVNYCAAKAGIVGTDDGPGARTGAERHHGELYCAGVDQHSQVPKNLAWRYASDCRNESRCGPLENRETWLQRLFFLPPTKPDI